MENNISCDIKKDLAVLTENCCYKKMLKLISWNGCEPKFDIRGWGPDGHYTRMGITLSDKEAHILVDALTAYFNDEETMTENEDEGTLPF